MHIEVLAEDRSGACLLDGYLLPKLLGVNGGPHTWRVIPYKGLGRLPQGLAGQTDPSKRVLLDQLPKVLSGYGKTLGVDAVLVVLDTDNRDCMLMLNELEAVVSQCASPPPTVFRLAIEEVEAWYLGDAVALLDAYPRAKKSVLRSYAQDSACGTWELLADAIHPGGSAALKKAGWPLPGQVKILWAQTIGPHLDIERNLSPSFCKLRDGVRRMVASP